MLEKIIYVLNKNSEEIRTALKEKYSLKLCSCCEFENAEILTLSWYISNKVHGVGYDDPTFPGTKEEIIYRTVTDLNKDMLITTDVDKFGQLCQKALKWKERRDSILKHWKKQKEPFGDNPDNIPEIPVLDREDMETYIFPKLIELGAIPKEQLKNGAKYLGSCRNAHEAVWNGERFIYRRLKFGDEFDEDIKHFQDDECDGYDVFVPIKEI